MNSGRMHSELSYGSLSDAEKAAISTQGAIIQGVAGGFFSMARMAVGSYRQDAVPRMFNSQEENLMTFSKSLASVALLALTQSQTGPSQTERNRMDRFMKATMLAPALTSLTAGALLAGDITGRET